MRTHVMRLLDAKVERIASQVLAAFPYAGPRVLGTDDRARLVEATLRLLAAAVRDGGVDARNSLVGDLRRLSLDLSIGPADLVALVYLVKRSALDELAEGAADDVETWPQTARIVRRAVFDLLGAFAERLTQERGSGELTDALTTLHSRRVVQAALEKELHRAERFGHPIAFVLFTVDRLAATKATHGQGFGDRVLERVGILLRNYFREQDWVGRWSEDTFAVLLPETPCAHAELLAERVRVTVRERLALRDYRTDERVIITVSAAAVVAEAVDMEVAADMIAHEAEQAVARAAVAGGNRVERMEMTSPSISVLGAARHLGITQSEVLDLVQAGRLTPVQPSRSIRFDLRQVGELKSRI